QEKGAGRLRITSKKQADQILKDVDRENFKVVKVTEKEKKTRPSAPFTTSSMQQAASTRINFNPKKTMKVAQELYEGVNIGRGTVGLITYMRTDSVRIADEARAYAQSLIKQEFGQEYVGAGIFSNKKKGSQDAHEAIRPADPGLRPDDIRDSLTSDQYKLYKLIWTRFMASQMADALYDGVSADIRSGKCLFRAAGSKVKFEGYLKVYNNTEEEKKSMIPALEAGENLKNTALEQEQHFTQPPSRFTEASLVKKLEDSQIGRPSTYAPIVGTLTERRYVKREKKTLFPTELGMTVDGMMEEYFKDIVDSKFTAEMENKLDSVEEGEIRWRKVVGDFYGPFNKELEFADKSIEKVEIEDVEIGRECPECGRPLVMKQGRFGEFIACKGYPECKHTETIMHTLGVQCPACGKELVQRRSRKGKYFYGCSGYPECNVVFWNKPVNRKCPKCGSILLEKVSRNGKLYVCSSEECKYTEKAEDNRNE
ncbi:MAG: type I DNA topoisomerase, partial [Clostridia bacterium]|nr:type I DNA topoisomerase [Clostridia bacterium]